MKTKILFISLLIAGIFNACVDEIPIQEWPVSPILVANSFISPDSVFRCDVFQISSLPDEQEHPIENAKVSIYDNETNELVSNLYLWKEGIYRSNTKPQVGKSYRLEVEVKGYTKLEATTKVPAKIMADSVYVFYNKDKENTDGMPVYYSELNFTIKDTDAASNFYDIVLGSFDTTTMYFDKYDQVHFDTLLIASSLNFYGPFGTGFSNTDEVLTHENLMQYDPASILFSDQLFNQSFHHFQVRTLYNLANYPFIALLSGSKEYYQYRKSQTIHLFNQADKQHINQIEAMKMDFSTHPVDMYSNIKGGYGIFAAYNTKLLFATCHPVFDTLYHIHGYLGDYSLPQGKIHFNKTSPCSGTK